MQLDKSSARVRQMFGEIAGRYDLLNHVLSLGIDLYWRRRTVCLVPLEPDGGPILDVCTGTGDLALAYWKSSGRKAQIVGTDFCQPMLVLADQKGRRRGRKAYLLARGRHPTVALPRRPFPDRLRRLRAAECERYGPRSGGDGPSLPPRRKRGRAGVLHAQAGAAWPALWLVFPSRTAADRAGLGPESSGGL